MSWSAMYAILMPICVDGQELVVAYAPWSQFNQYQLNCLILLDRCSVMVS